MKRGELGLLGGQSNLEGLLGSLGVGCGWRNIGVSRLRKCTVREVWLLSY